MSGTCTNASGEDFGIYIQSLKNIAILRAFLLYNYTQLSQAKLNGPIFRDPGCSHVKPVHHTFRPANPEDNHRPNASHTIAKQDYSMSI
jgi:hypothetical protein